MTYESGEVKINSTNGVFLGRVLGPVRSRSDSSLGTGLLLALQINLLPSLATRLLAFITSGVLRLLVSKATVKLGRRHEIEQVKTLESLLFL